ncbi:MAG: exodeoxyribonuclease III [Planctomycetota bacterium]|nr:exodeoxyribonuclease III [Planctomycetota bacterium]
MRIVSWNVNGIRAVEKKGFSDWLEGAEADIVGVQEVRAKATQFPPHLAEHPDWHLHVVEAERPGYSGVALFSKRPPDRVHESLDDPAHDAEGRLQIARYGRLVVANAYFPNGSGKNRDNSRVPFKLDFYRRLFDRVQRLRRGGARVLVMGDFNTAHREIDLARPKSNQKTSGFLPEEREALDRWIEAGWIDTFRRFEPGPDRYTWWSQRFGVRERNVGWRIDYVLASPNVKPFLRDAFIHAHVMGSDHCPIGVDLDPAVLD